MAMTLATRGTRASRQVGFGHLVFKALDVWKQRRALATLDIYARRDLGLSLDEVMLESARPLWDLPHQGRF
jgi:hypothetical protein